MWCTACKELLLSAFLDLFGFFDIKKKKKKCKVSIKYKYRKYHICNITTSQTPLVCIQILVDHVENELAAYKCILTTLSVILAYLLVF